MNDATRAHISTLCVFFSPCLHLLLVHLYISEIHRRCALLRALSRASPALLSFLNNLGHFLIIISSSSSHRSAVEQAELIITSTSIVDTTRIEVRVAARATLPFLLQHFSSPASFFLVMNDATRALISTLSVFFSMCLHLLLVHLFVSEIHRRCALLRALSRASPALLSFLNNIGHFLIIIIIPSQRG